MKSRSLVLVPIFIRSFWLRGSAIAFACFLAIGSSAVRAAPARIGTEVLVAADAIEVPDGFRPKAGQPIFYLLSLTQKSLGDSVAGVKIPDRPLVENVIVTELKKQGFIRAEVGGPMPSIVIFATWGDSNFEPANDSDVEQYLNMVPDTRGGQTLSEDEKKAEAARMAFLNSSRAKDKPAIESIVGLGKINAPDGTGMKVMHAANENRYYLSLAALDAVRFVQKKEKVLLWRTSMSIDWRNDFRVALKTMLESGGPFFGTNSKEPVFLDERDRRNAEVKIGETKVVPDETPAPPPAKK